MRAGAVIRSNMVYEIIPWFQRNTKCRYQTKSAHISHPPPFKRMTKNLIQIKLSVSNSKTLLK